jgi:tetratricopeptide (TPR) repeat protein
VGYLHVAPRQHDKAEAAFRQSMSILEKAAEESPEVADYRRTLMSDYHRLGHVLKITGRPREAEEYLRRNVATSERLAADYADVADDRLHLYQACRALGDFLKEAGRSQEAEARYRRAVDVARQLVADFPNDTTTRGAPYSAYRALGDAFKEAGRYQDAVPPYRQAVDLARQLVADAPDVAEHRWNLFFTERNLADALKEAGRSQEAAAPYRHAVDLARQFLADAPDVAAHRRNLLDIAMKLADVLKEAGRYHEAMAPYRQAVDLARQLVADASSSTKGRQAGSTKDRQAGVAAYRRDLLVCDRCLARLLIHLDRFAEAEQVYRQTIALDEKLAAASPNLAADRVGPSETHAALADLLCITGRCREAAEEYRRALAARPAYAEGQWKLAWFLANCPDPQYRDPAQAIALAKQIVALPQVEVEPVGSSIGVRGFRQGFYWRALGVAYYRAGEWDNAITCLEKSSVFHGGLCTCGWSVLAMAHWRRGDKEEARRCYERAYRWMEEHTDYSKEPCFYWEEEFRRWRGEAAEVLGLPDPGQPKREEPAPKKN